MATHRKERRESVEDEEWQYLGIGAVLTSDYILPRVPSSRRGSLQAHESLAQGAVLRPPENRSRVRPDRSVQVRRVRSVFLGRAKVRDLLQEYKKFGADENAVKKTAMGKALETFERCFFSKLKVANGEILARKIREAEGEERVERE